jgi:hypothetical protein
MSVATISTITKYIMSSLEKDATSVIMYLDMETSSEFSFSSQRFQQAEYPVCSIDTLFRQLKSVGCLRRLLLRTHIPLKRTCYLHEKTHPQKMLARNDLEIIYLRARMTSSVHPVSKGVMCDKEECVHNILKCPLYYKSLIFSSVMMKIQ